MNKLLVIILFVGLAGASGCIEPGNGQTSPIQINEMSVTPSSIDEGSETQVLVEIENRGEHEIEMDYGNNGRRILADYCRSDFDIVEGSFDVSTNDELNEDEDQLILGPDRLAAFEWELSHEGDVRGELGGDCEIRFEVPFRYTVSTFREVEILEDPDIQPSETHPRSTSTGPLTFGIQAGDAEHEPVYVGGDDIIPARLQLQKQTTAGRGGLVDVDPESLRIYATDPLELNETLSVEGRRLETVVDGDYENPRCDFGTEADFHFHEGTTRVYNCQVPTEEIDRPAVSSDIVAEMEYEYTEQIGTRYLEVRDIG